MKIADIPTKFNIPFANSAGAGYITTIPEASQIPITPGRASLTTGFPPLTFLPVGSGGVPPFGADMNGLMKQVTQWSRWQAAAGPVPYDGTFSTAIGGYPKGALVGATSFSGFWISTVDDNTSNPEAGGANWLPFYPYRKVTLTADADYYVATTGSNSNPGSSGSPWLTLQYAWDYILANVDFNGYNVTVHVGNGTYTAGVNASGVLTGAKSPTSLTFIGDTTTPANVIVNVAASWCFLGTYGAQFRIRGFQLLSGDAQNGCIVASYGANILFDSVRFSTTTAYHIYATAGGVIRAAGNYTVIGAAAVHLYSTTGGYIDTAATITVTISGTPAFGTSFAYCRINSILDYRSSVVTFSGSATGKRYTAELAGNIYTEGGGANFFPGNSAGSTATNGIYN